MAVKEVLDSAWKQINEHHAERRNRPAFVVLTAIEWRAVTHPRGVADYELVRGALDSQMRMLFGCPVVVVDVPDEVR